MKPEVIPLTLHADDRGMVYGALTDLDKRGIKRTYVVRNWSKGMIRAWHGHRKADTYMHVIKGAAKVAAVQIDQEPNKPREELVTVLTEHTPGILFVPAGYFNGAMSLEDDTRILVYSTLVLEDVKNDDVRKHYADSTLSGDRIWKVEPR
jgi:dTDP-4-dehydrorhamnose 3,5-epimerase-like enzyme